MHRKHKSIGFNILLIILFFAASCSRLGEEDGALPVDQSTTVSVDVTATLSPEPEPSPTFTPEPTPISAHVTMNDQTLDESGELVAESVTLPGPGWLAIYNSTDGQPSEVIGHVPLVGGLHEDVVVNIDTDVATEQLFAGVHMDVGTEGVFDFPGEDEPYPNEPETEFTIELLLPQPQIEGADQAIAEDGILTLARVELLDSTWVLVHTDVEGEIGPVIASQLLDEGIHENVVLTIDWRRATPILHVVLHEDDGESGIMEFPDADMPILVNGKPIVSDLKATYPPEVLVYDQPVIDGSITIERAISEGNGWIAVYNEIEGQPGFIIGNAALEDGLNEGINVSLLQSGITEQLFARIHQDTEPGDAFNFPGQDPAVLYNNRLPTAAAFRTDTGAQAFIHDQRLTESDAVRVAAIVSPVDGWATIYNSTEGEPGELLGRAWFPAGVNRNVEIQLDPSPEPGDLFLVLYKDLGQSETFETDMDTALANDDNRPIRIPFILQ